VFGNLAPVSDFLVWEVIGFVRQSIYRNAAGLLLLYFFDQALTMDHRGSGGLVACDSKLQFPFLNLFD
jgi:hypothetical protein